MKTKYLLPHKFKKWGWIIFIPSFLLGLIVAIFGIEPSFLNFNMPAIFTEELLGDFQVVRIVKTNLIDEILMVLIIISLLTISFSIEKQEDEYINKIRLESLVWSVFTNYGILLFTIILVFEMSFFWVLIVNMFTLLILFVSKFNWQLYKFKKQVLNEE